MMKKSMLLRLLFGCCLCLTLLFSAPFSRPVVAASMPDVGDIGLCATTDQKIDLNNANLLAFTDCPGFYPALASAILVHGPYQSVEEVLSIPDLNPQQKALLKSNLKSFSAETPVVPVEKRMPPRITQPSH
jgi:photosystem II PsbU protein